MKKRKNEDSLTETSSISEEISSRVLRIPEILLHVFGYLNDEDLQQCGQVCSYWKDVTEDILYKKIAMFRKKIPISMLNNLAENPEKLRPFVKYNRNFQYLWLYSKPRIDCHWMCPRCPKQKIPPTEDEVFDAVTFFKENKNKENFQLPFNVHPSTEDEIQISIAMFPSSPGVNIRHFLFTIEERNAINREGISYVSKLLNIPEEKLKCVIGIREYGIQFHDDGSGEFTTYTLEKKIRKGIAFYGQSFQAVSLCIQRIENNYCSVKEKLKRLKCLKPKMVQKRCFAFIFRRICKNNMGPILEAFKSEFPSVTTVDYLYFPQFELLNPTENYNFDCVDVGLSSTHVVRIVFLWYE